MNLGLEGKAVLVTGGAKGIGAGIVRSFVKEGAKVSIVDRNPDVAALLIEELQDFDGEAICVPTELTDESACREAIGETVDWCGRLDVLVHNAGVNDGVGLEASPQEFLGSLQKNLMHVFSLTHHALPHLEKAKGTIINIGSKVAETGQGGTSGYAASKGALNALTREWALDLSSKGIRVNAVIPAEVMTPLYEKWLATLKDPKATLDSIHANIPLGNRMTTAEEIADSVVFLASERSSHTTGQIFHPDGGYVHFDRAFGKVKVD
ncbi:MAG: short-chain dehydrogenase [Opitutae bacterium]|nr:short-chain dehydrogenase [Opitutae bacterium]|tara:strand:+ start:834 stop:1628 length:795 start_codon:yes stop_codon:yes gene_type:complete